MVSTITDRLYGESSGVAVKAPVVAVASSPISLVGLAPISTPAGSYTPSAGNRILAASQSDPTTNGIYNASVSGWTRSGDFDGAYDCVQGTIIVVYPGNGLTLWYQLTTASPVIGTTPLVFVALNNPNQVYPQSLAEQVAGVTPLNITYRPGSFQRYGMDPLGVADSSPGLAAAISCNDFVFDEYPGGGNYIGNSQVNVSRYPLRISGATKTAGGGTGGTRFTLQTAAGANAALLHWAATVFDTTIENIAFQWQTNTTGQIALLFDTDVRSCRIRDCTFNGGAITSSTNITAIKLTATGGTFCGDVTIERNYINNVQTGMYLGPQCTTVRILDNELAVTLGVIPTCYGLNDQATSVGVLVAGCTFEQWTYGIFVNSGGIRQFHNYFEANVAADFYWGNTRQNVSIGDISTGTALATFTVNDTTANVVFGGSYFALYGAAAAFYVDSISMGASRGFIDKYTQAQGIAAYGQWNTIAFAAGNFVGNGSQTWAVSGGNVSLEEYAVVGNTMHLHLEVDSSSVGGAANTQVQYTMPLVAQTSAFFPCAVRVNGTRQMAVCQSLAGSKQLIIYVDATRATNWAASSGNAGVSVNVAVRVNA